MTAASNADGAAVTLQTCTGADAQKWTFEDGSVKVFGSKCLDVVNGQNVDGTKLQIWTCSTNKDPNQQFFYTGDYRLSWTNHGKCTDLPGGSLTDGNRVNTCCFAPQCFIFTIHRSKFGPAAVEIPTRHVSIPL